MKATELEEVGCEYRRVKWKAGSHLNNPSFVVQEARICLLASAAMRDSADPTDALLVLLSGPLSLMHGELFEPHVFVTRVKEQFGWVMSAEAVEYFVPSLRKRGWLKARTGLPARGPFYVDIELNQQDLAGADDTREALTKIGDEFRTFASGLSPINALPDDSMEAGAILLRHAVDSTAPIEGAVHPESSDEDYLAARFIEHANKHKLPAQELLASLSAVGFLFRVAEEIGNPSQRRTVNLKVIVDGPMILDYLGCSGDIRSEASVNVFDSLRAMGATTLTFSHCVDEARDALRSVLKALPRDRYGPTGEALRKGLVNENALLGMLQAFDVVVRNKGIEILPDTIDFMPSSHVHFDETRAAGVEAIINWHDEVNNDARYADADTTVLTIRRRGGHRTSDLFDSRYVCVTTNDIFVGATKRHLLEIAYYNARQVPPIISLKELAAKLWIEIGNRNAETRLQIPNSQLLLSCERSLRLNRKVVEQARAELLKVRPEQLEQFELLLEVPRSARAVMDVTLNNDRYVSGDTIEQLVEAAVAAAGEEAAAKEKAKRTKDREKFERKLSEVEEELQAERVRIEETENSANQLAAEKESNDTATLDALVDRASERFGSIRCVVRTISIVVALVPIIGLIGLANSDKLTLLVGLLGAAAILLAAASAMDTPGAWLSKLIHSFLDRWVVQRLREVARHDLANCVHLSWSDGKMSWERAE